MAWLVRVPEVTRVEDCRRNSGEEMYVSGSGHFAFSANAHQCLHNGPMNGVVMMTRVEAMQGLNSMASLSPRLTYPLPVLQIYISSL